MRPSLAGLRDSERSLAALLTRNEVPVNRFLTLSEFDHREEALQPLVVDGFCAENPVPLEIG